MEKEKILSNHRQNLWNTSILDAVWFLYFLMSYILGNVFGYSHYLTTIILLAIPAFSQSGKIYLTSWGKPILRYYFIFSSWIMLSWIWATSSSTAQQTIAISLIEILILLVCIINYIQKDVNKIQNLISIFVNATAVFAIIYYISSPISTWGTEKMGGFTPIWRNAAGYYFGYAAIFAIFLYLISNKKRRLLFLGVFLAIAAIGTGSRKVFVQFALAVLMYILLQRGVGKKVKMFVGIGFAVIVIIAIGSQVPAFQTIYAGRLFSIFSGLESTDSSTVTRAYMRQYALDLFKQHPFIGSGLNGYTNWIAGNRDFLSRWNVTATYSHCNYTELLANSGMIGFVLYYFFPVIEVFKSRKIVYNNYVRLGIIVIISFIVLDYGTISYYMRFYAFVLFIGLMCLRAEDDEEREYE